MNLHEYDLVRLKRAWDDPPLPAGTIGTVVMVYTDPPGFEVEVADANGITLALLSVKETDIEHVSQ